MRLEEFIKTFVGKNCLINLWKRHPKNNQVLTPVTNIPMMEFNILKHRDLCNLEVDYIRDTVGNLDSTAINIIVYDRPVFSKLNTEVVNKHNKRKLSHYDDEHGLWISDIVFLDGVIEYDKHLVLDAVINGPFKDLMTKEAYLIVRELTTSKINLLHFFQTERIFELIHEYSSNDNIIKGQVEILGYYIYDDDREK